MEFGTEWRPVVLGIPEEVELGCSGGFRRMRVDSRWNSGCGRKGNDAGILVVENA